MDNESTHSITVTIEQPRWRSVVTDPAKVCLEAAYAVLAKAGEAAEGPSLYEAGILLTDDAAITALNRDWRGKDTPTNVLSFPAGDAEAVFPPGAPRLLGDVVLAHETVTREAAAAGTSCADHLAHLVVHGFLHLLGHDHESEAEALRMEGLETEILAGLGIADPYGEAAA